MIPDTVIENVKEILRVSDVVGRRVKLKRSGRAWLGLCCFHQEKTASLHCDDPRGTWKCFGCGVGGDIVEFTRMAYGYSFVEAVTELAKEAGVTIPQISAIAIKHEAHRLSLMEVLEEARQWFTDQLKQSPEAQAYLKERKITDEQVETFGIGFAPDGRSRLKQALGERAGVDGLAHGGLLVSGEGVPVAYDRFRSRVVFPIRDVRGRTISFGGRLIGDGEPKYLNGPSTPVFDKSSTLYNADQAREHAHQTGELLVVEGYFDVLACSAAGYPATVGTMGTSVTTDQVVAMWRLSECPVLMFDGDAAGAKAAQRAMIAVFSLLKPGRSIKVARLPQGHDPDSLVARRGPGALRVAIAGAAGLADAFWQSFSPGNGPDAVAKLEQALMAILQTIPDDGLRARYREDAKRRLRALGKAKSIIRANGYSNHSTNPGAVRLIHGLPPPGRFTMKEACALAAVIKAKDIDTPTLPGLSDRTYQVIAEIHHLLLSMPEEELAAALNAGNVGEAVNEAYAVLHSAGIAAYDVEGF